MSLSAQACWVIGQQCAELRTEELPPLVAGQVLVRTLYTAISRGTESLVFHGRIPASEYQRMRAPYQQGDFPSPVKYGYINVGMVEEGPANLLGKRVFSLFPHQTRFVLPSDALTLLPKGLPAARAVLAAGMETAVNVLWDSDMKVGDRVAVVGAGVIGCLCAYLAQRTPGVSVQLIDTNPDRGPIADALGCEFSGPGNCGRNFDLVIHASGSGVGLETSLQIAGVETKIVDMSWYGDSEVSLPLGQAFHSRRLQLVSSQVGTIPATQRSRWSYKRRLELALRLLDNPRLDCLISGESDFGDLPRTLEEVTSSADSLCHRIRYPQTP